MATALDMNATPIAWGETYTALQQGTVDGEGNTYSLLNDAKHTEVLKYATDTYHNYSMHVLLINKKFFNKLPPEDQKMIMDAGKETIIWQRNISVELEDKAIEAFKARGIKIYNLSASDRDELVKMSRPVWEQFRNDIPQDLIQLILDTQK